MKVQGNGKSITISKEQRLELKKHLPEKYAILFDICYYTAGRISEIISIRWIDIVENTIVIIKSNTKTKETREVAVPPELIRKIYKLPNEGAYIFCGRNGQGHITRQAAHYQLTNACKRAGILGASSHSWRRTAITELHRNNIPVKTICAISGHRSLSALQEYIDVSQEEVLDALQSRW